MTVLRATEYKNNAHLIAAAALLGYLPEPVRDVTYGLGKFWTVYKPDVMVTSDLNTGVDFRALPDQDREFATVVYDPPYKYQGTSQSTEMDDRYGTDENLSWQNRDRLLYRGLTECCRVANRFVLVKCMDQVVSGKFHSQTYWMTAWGLGWGFELHDRLDYLHAPRPQPEGRRQVHALANYSTLLVLKRRTYANV